MSPTIKQKKIRWCHNGCFWNRMLSELVVLLISYFATLYMFYLEWMCVLWTKSMPHLSCCHCHVTSVSYDTHKSSPMASWDSKMCTSKSQQKQQVIKKHSVHFAYCFMNTMNWVILLYSHTVFHLLYSREECIFGYSQYIATTGT